jgi:hypothetical protein
MRIHDLRAWKNAHVGVLFIDNPANLIAEGLALMDNHIGITGSFHRQEGDMSHYFFLRDSLILGRTQASDCDKSWKPMARRGEEASTNMEEKGSVFPVRHQGVMLPTITNRGKTCEDGALLKDCWVPNAVERPCGLPWEQRYGTRGARTSNYLFSRLTLGGFPWQECLKKHIGVAFSYNPTARDWNPGLNVEETTWLEDIENVPPKIPATPNVSRFFMSPAYAMGMTTIALRLRLASTIAADVRPCGCKMMVPSPGSGGPVPSCRRTP